MSLVTYHEWDYNGKHYRAVYDPDYQPDKCCGAATKGKHLGDEKGTYCGREGQSGEESCEKWWQEEIDNLNSGEWVALGVIVTRKCEGSNVWNYLHDAVINVMTDAQLDTKPPMLREKGLTIRQYLMTIDRGKKTDHCEACSGTVQIDSLWGIVVENSNKAIEEFVKEGGM